MSFPVRRCLRLHGLVSASAVAILAAGLLLLPLAWGSQTTATAPGGDSAPATVQDEPHAAAKTAAESQALGFLQYLDQKRFRESYAYTSRLLRAQLGQAEFARKVEEARAPVGQEKSRELLNASYTTTLKGQPAGEYVVLQYGTDFSKRPDATETLVMSFENGYWRVAGWFIK